MNTAILAEISMMTITGIDATLQTPMTSRRNALIDATRMFPDML
jgi:hypothetical protein